MSNHQLPSPTNTNKENTNMNITFSDLARAGMATAKPVEATIDFDVDTPQFKAPRPFGDDPMASVQAYEAAARAMTEMMEQSESFENGYDDVAVCFWRVLTSIDGGLVRSIRTGPNPPSERTVPVGYDRNGNMQYETVPDGWMLLPGGLGKAVVQRQVDNTGIVHMQFTRNNQMKVQGLLHFVREELRLRSIYRGQIIDWNYGFINVANHDENKLVFNEDIQASINVNVKSRILDIDEIERKGRKVKRSVLLNGAPGTGKSEVIRLAMSMLFKLGYGGVLIPPGSGPAELDRGLKVARTMQRPGSIVGVFVEDVEKMAEYDRARTLDMLDGPKTKSDRVLIVMTTNFAEDITDEAFLRRGRVDAYIVTRPPDREAFEKLLKLRCGDVLADDVDYDRLYESYEGMTPAWIDGAIDEIELAHIARTGSGDIETITTDDLFTAYALLRPQWDLSQGAADRKPPPVTIDSLLRGYIDRQAEGVKEHVNEMTLDEYETRRLVNDLVDGLLNATRVYVENENGDVWEGGLSV